MVTCSWVTMWQRGQRTQCFLTSPLVTVQPSHTEHFEALRSGRQHGENVCWADILRHTTRHDSQDPPAWLTVVCLDSVFSLEFPSVECFSTFYSSWFIPTDWSVRAEGENIMFYSNHYDSFKQWTPRLHCRCIPCLHPSFSTDWSDSWPHSIQRPFVARHQLTRRLIHADQNLSVSAWPPFHSSPQRLFSTVFSPFTGLIRWVLLWTPDSTTNPLRLPKFLFPFPTPG